MTARFRSSTSRTGRRPGAWASGICPTLIQDMSVADGVIYVRTTLDGHVRVGRRGSAERPPSSRWTSRGSAPGPSRANRLYVGNDRRRTGYLRRLGTHTTRSDCTARISPGGPYGVAIVGTFACIANGDDTLRLVDVTNSLKPTGRRPVRRSQRHAGQRLGKRRLRRRPGRPLCHRPVRPRSPGRDGHLRL